MNKYLDVQIERQAQMDKLIDTRRQMDKQIERQEYEQIDRWIIDRQLY